MEIQGTITKILEPKSGVNKQGKDWTKQDIILHMPGEYPKDVCITFWKDAETLNIEVGKQAKVQIDISSREYNDKWYTDIKGIRLELSPQTADVTEGTNDLPF